MAFVIRNLEKFLDDTPEFQPRKKEILAEAKKLIELDGVTITAHVAEIVLGPEWSEIFLHLLETDFDHIQIFMNELSGRRR